MMKRMFAALLALCLMAGFVPEMGMSSAKAMDLLDALKSMDRNNPLVTAIDEKTQNTPFINSTWQDQWDTTPRVVFTPSYNFGFLIADDGLVYAQWDKTNSRVIRFRVKMSNTFAYETVDAYTLEISAQNVYEEPILLKCSDGNWYESLWYTGDNVYKPGKSGYSQYFRLEGEEKIKYVTVKLVKFHTEEGTTEVDDDYVDEYTWTIK